MPTYPCFVGLKFPGQREEGIQLWDSALISESTELLSGSIGSGGNFGRSGQPAIEQLNALPLLGQLENF